MRKCIHTALLLFSINFLFAQTHNPFLRFPALSTDGTQLSFSYQGDIWVVSTDGGKARRITIHEAYESRPQWSPDDQFIAFQSNRFGNDDIFITTPDGQRPQRVTHYSGRDGQAKWTNDGQLLFNSTRFFAEVEREPEILHASSLGGTPYRLMDALGFSPAPSPDGRFIAFVRGTCRTSRESYKGPANRDIWLYDTQNDSYSQLTDFEGQDILPDWGGNNQLYYLSAENGRYNIQVLSLSENGTVTDKKVITSYTDEGIRHFDVSANGSHLVFEKGISLYHSAIDGYEDPKPLEIDVVHDYRFDPEESKEMTRDASELALSPNGKMMAFVVRGDIFISYTDKDKKKSIKVSQHAFRERSPQWLSDTTLIYLSDRNGSNDLFMVRSADPAQSDLMKTLKREEKVILQSPEEETNILLSPDKKQLAYRKGRGQLIVADISADGILSNSKTLLDGWAIPANVSWSPDSKWLAYALDDLNFNREIYIHPADNSSLPVNVSMHPRRDNNPVWSADGSKLGFLSQRNNGDADVWFVWLKKEDWEKTKADWEEVESDEKPDKKEGKEEFDKKEIKNVVQIEIDFEDIHERLEQVTRLAGNEGDLAVSKDGEFFYYSTNGGDRQGRSGDRDYMSIKWDGTDAKVLINDKALREVIWDNDNSHLFLVDSRGTLSKLNPKGKSSDNIPFEARLNIDYETELRQIFNDAWRALRDGFYDPDFHGQDWAALKNKYEELAVHASTTQDFRDLFNEMLGQVNASHMGLFGPDREETQEQQTGLLGVEVVPEENGVRVTRVIKNSPASKSSSLLKIDDLITAVNGEPVTSEINFYSLLTGTVNERTLLTVSGDEAQVREVVIRPSGSLRTELYENWVQQQKQLTEQYSNGRLGYIHIRGMNWNSFERFERELTASGLGKEGIIIDVRFNGGGWTTDMLMTVLNVRQHAYTIPRGAAENLKNEHPKFKTHYPFGERLPLSALTKPSIALCNENSYSNAEIFSHAYKHLGHGTLVGQPTFGAVISTGSYRLMDGSRVRMPYRAWYVKATEENMEWGPAVPDIIVENTPEGKANNQDNQLKKAVETLLQQIGE